MTQGTMAGEAVGASSSGSGGASGSTADTADTADTANAPDTATTTTTAGAGGAASAVGTSAVSRFSGWSTRLQARTAALFPLSPAASAVRGRRWVAVLGGAGAVAGLTAASLMRQDGTAAADSMWAEDGQIFYQQSVEYGFLQVLVRPYNGYLHVVPRVLMELVRVFPMADAAAATAVIGALVTSALALLVYVASGTHLSSRALRISVAAPVGLTWVAQLELGNNLLSLHIFMLYVAFWLCLWNPRSRAALVLGAVVLGLTAASDPLVGVYIPLLALRVWTLRGPRRWVPAAGLGAGLAVQAAAVVFEKALDTRNPAAHYDAAWAAHGYSSTVVGALFHRTGTGVDSYMNGPSGWPVYLGWAAVAAAVLCALLRWTRPDWPLAGLAFVHSVTIFGVLAMKGGSLTPRYVLPALGLLLVTLAALLRPRPRMELRPRLRTMAPAWCLLVVAAIAVWHGYAAGTWVRSGGPSWVKSIRQAAVMCRTTGAADDGLPTATGIIEVPCSLVAHRGFFEFGTGPVPDPDGHKP